MSTSSFPVRYLCVWQRAKLDSSLRLREMARGGVVTGTYTVLSLDSWWARLYIVSAVRGSIRLFVERSRNDEEEKHAIQALFSSSATSCGRSAFLPFDETFATPRSWFDVRSTSAARDAMHFPTFETVPVFLSFFFFVVFDGGFTPLENVGRFCLNVERLRMLRLF